MPFYTALHRDEYLISGESLDAVLAFVAESAFTSRGCQPFRSANRRRRCETMKGASVSRVT